MILRREVAADLRRHARIFQRGDDAGAELLAGDANLAVVGDPDELRNERAVREPIAAETKIGGRGKGERHFLGDRNRLIDRNRIRCQSVAAARAIDDVTQRPSARIFMRDEGSAVDDVDRLILRERSSAQSRDDALRVRRACGERFAIAAGEAPQREEAAELSVLNTRRAPQFTQRIRLEFLEKNVRTKLLVWLVLRRHRGTSPLVICGRAVRITRRK